MTQRYPPRTAARPEFRARDVLQFCGATGPFRRNAAKCERWHRECVLKESTYRGKPNVALYGAAPFALSTRPRKLAVCMRLARLLTIVLLGVGFTGCDIPQDPEGTLKKARGGGLLVGVTESPPWVRRTPAGAAGVEADLVREFADQLGAEVHWCWSDSEANLAALERYRLDLVIGNLTKSSPWSRRVAFATPYYTETLTVGYADLDPPPVEGWPTIQGVKVCVQEGSTLAALLEEEGALPQPVSDLWRCEPPIAAAQWELEAHGLRAVPPPLQTRKHVMAAPPGENAFVVALSRFLAGRHGAVHRRLVEAAPEHPQEPSRP